MNIHILQQYFIWMVILILICSHFSFNITSHRFYDQCKQSKSRIEEGYILFAPMYSSNSYLIDTSGVVSHTWSSTYPPGESVYMLNDGTILRTIKLVPAGNGAGGGIQKISWNGTILWEYRYATDVVLSHHDIEPLPNGNVLMIAWETKTRNEAIESGRDPAHVGTIFRPDHIIEVKSTGPTTGEIVWEWHVWDHLIQDYDPTELNYGIVADHPELIDINYGNSQDDWLHCNSIDYNEEYDQILISSKFFHEIWVIDHSTTTQEAAGHTGGNSGKGGDILYRWGNPVAYRAGTINDEMLFSQHDASWIESGYPGAGNILIFNNGKNRPISRYSSVDEIVPPIDTNGTYYLTPSSAYGPDAPIWSYTSNPPTLFYADFLSGCQRLPNGNTLICDGVAGHFFEVTPTKEIVWEYINPYPAPIFNNVFKIQYIPQSNPQTESDLDCDGSIQMNNVKKDEILFGSFIVKNIGGADSLLNWTINSFPSWGTWSFTPSSGQHLAPADGPCIVNVTIIAPNRRNKEYEGSIMVINTNNSQDFDIIPVYLKTPKTGVLFDVFSFVIQNILVRFPFIRLLFSHV